MAKKLLPSALMWRGNPEEIDALTRWFTRVDLSNEDEIATVVRELDRVIESEGYGLKYRVENPQYGPFAVVVASEQIEPLLRVFHIATMYVIPIKVTTQRGEDFNA
ncbi:hypothetical protein SEA_ARACELI_48 [Streptomyces phage Araceli]|nr:hypothetical protein SEA_ARACELI_48 [Streptomyces phage Araceli]